MQMSNYSIRHFLLIICLLIMVIAFVGCSFSPIDTLDNGNTVVSYNVTSTATTSVSPLVTQSPSETPEATVIVTRSPSLTPKPTASLTPLPSKTPTLTPTVLPTLTPLPTILSQQRGQTYSELMSSNGGCVLPCWWGIELAATSINEVRQLYTSLGADISEQNNPNGISIFEATFLDPQIEKNTQVRHMFITREDMLTEALIEIVFDPNYQITSLLQQLGEPSDVWLWTIPELYEGILPVRFRLYFPEQGVFVLYSTGGMKIDNSVHVCFEDTGGVILLLWEPDIWDPDGTKGIVDRSNEGGSQFTLEGFPIEEVSNWDVEAFYEILTDPAQSECLETPSNLWSPP